MHLTCRAMMTEARKFCKPRSEDDYFTALSVGRTALVAVWYGAVLVPDAQGFLHRALYSNQCGVVQRICEGSICVLELASMPNALISGAPGRAHLGRIASLGVVLNPPTFLLSALIVHGAASALIGAVGRTMRRLVRAALPSGNNANETAPESRT